MFFSSDKSKATIENILAMHFVRSGREDVAQVFLKVSDYMNCPASKLIWKGVRFAQESGISFPQDILQRFAMLHKVTNAIRSGDLAPAFE